MSFEEIVAAFQVKSKYALSTEQANVCRLVYDQCRLGNGQQRNVILGKKQRLSAECREA